MGVFFGNLELVGPKLIYPGPWLACGSSEAEFLKVRRTGLFKLDKKNQPQQRLECSRAIKISPF